jgi:hypothetical protein
MSSHGLNCRFSGLTRTIFFCHFLSKIEYIFLFYFCPSTFGLLEIEFIIYLNLFSLELLQSCDSDHEFYQFIKVG